MILDDFRFKLALDSISDADVRETALALIGERERANNLEKQVAKYANEVANLKALGPKTTPKPT